MEKNNKRTIDTGTDFSGIGAFDIAVDSLGFKQNKMFACDKDKYARQTYLLNNGKPKHFPKNVNERKIPKKSLDIYVTTPPCQGYSLTGKRNGSLLFFNSLNFIEINKPKTFIFENVTGLMSHEKTNEKAKYGRTFNLWLSLLGGKSINGNMTLFPNEDAVPYHIHFKVLNSKEHGVPQNRKRVFIVGIRDDKHHDFQFPKTETLTIKVKDLIEENVDKKYYLKPKMIKKLTYKTKKATINDKTFDEVKLSGKILINSNTIKGYEIAEKYDTVNFSHLESKTKRGRVGKGICQTLDTLCTQGVVVPCTKNPDKLTIRRLTPKEAFRIMGFPENFKWNVSDSQAYKQAGNSIVPIVLRKIISKLQF